MGRVATGPSAPRSGVGEELSFGYATRMSKDTLRRVGGFVGEIATAQGAIWCWATNHPKLVFIGEIFSALLPVIAMVGLGAAIWLVSRGSEATA